MRYCIRRVAAALTGRLLALTAAWGAGDLSPELAAEVEAWVARSLELAIDLCLEILWRWRSRGRERAYAPPRQCATSRSLSAGSSQCRLAYPSRGRRSRTSP
jgi:hypothetical protein